MKTKGKSSHDLLKDKQLSSRPAVHVDYPSKRPHLEVQEDSDEEEVSLPLDPHHMSGTVFQINSDSAVWSTAQSNWQQRQHKRHKWPIVRGITSDHWSALTLWGRVTHICIDKLTIIGSDNGLSPGLSQAIIWTIAGILLIGPLGTNFSEILIKIITFSFKKMPLKVSSAKWRQFVLASMC